MDMKKGKWFYPIFLREKIDESFRLILNRKRLNKNTQKVDVKMETIAFILKLITVNMYFRKIDVKDAYILSQYIRPLKKCLHGESCIIFFGSSMWVWGIRTFWPQKTRNEKSEILLTKSFNHAKFLCIIFYAKMPQYSHYNIA